MTALQRACSARTMLDRMMECSQQLIAEAARLGDSQQRLLASRVLESARSRKHWENSHCQQLRSVANARATDEQVRAIRRMGLTMIHRKAPFEYLRNHRLDAQATRRFFQVAYGHQDFSKSFVSEHRNFLEAGASYLCMDLFCGESTMLAMSEYEQRYAFYLRTQLRQLDDVHCGRQGQTANWLEYLRNDLRRQRRALLGAPPSRADSLTLEELYRPTGDTVRIARHAPAETGYR